jgi:hypothetical protein
MTERSVSFFSGHSECFRIHPRNVYGKRKIYALDRPHPQDCLSQQTILSNEICKMPAHLTCRGVYIEEIPRGVRNITRVSTSVAAVPEAYARRTGHRARTH